jgi:transposase
VRATTALPATAAAIKAAVDTPPAPFSQVFITITKQEHIELRLAATRWQGLHHKEVNRCAQQEVRHDRLVGELKAQALKSNAALQCELDLAQGQVRDLQKRLYSTKSEQSRPSESRSNAASCRKRGQQRGTVGHGRSVEARMSERHEDVVLDKAQCPECGLALKEFPGTEDTQVLEIEVKAYRRVIHRHRYSPMCQCGCVSGIVPPPSPARLIARGKFGISVWTSVLLDKFAYGRASQRLLQDLADHGLNMAPGTLAGGLQAIAPLFKPLDAALLCKLRSEPYWHVDETRWAVFIDVLGKVGHRWYMWVFQSCSVVHYVVDESRAAEVIIAQLAGVKTGIISCDRYSGYKRFARLNPGVKLAYCWAHQRRDFLDLGNSYPESTEWALQWVDRIGNLYHLDRVRRKLLIGSPERVSAQLDLEQAVQQMAADCAAGVADHETFPPAAKVLESMSAHWAGLIVFVTCPWVDIDNNQAERSMRTPVVGRKNFNGSGSKSSAELAATMYSLFATMKLWGLNLRTWLTAYLQACAENGNVPPVDLNAFLPWQMNAQRLAQMRVCRPQEILNTS